LDEYTRNKLEKIDDISEAVTYIKGKMEIIEKYSADIKENTKDINNLGKKVRGLETDVESLKEDMKDVKKKTDCQDEDIKSIGDKSTNFWIKILLGIVSGLTGIILLLAQKIGVL